MPITNHCYLCTYVYGINYKSDTFICFKYNRPTNSDIIRLGQCYYGAYPDVRVVELYDSTVGIEEVRPVEEERVKVFPNPAGNTVTFSYTLPGKTNNALLSLFGTDGRLVFRRQLNAGKSSFQYNCAHLKAGVYHYKVTAAGKTVAGKLVIVR
jgi:hypothetical protein